MTIGLGLLAFAVIIFHSILDSSDGQLARMTGQVSEFGRMLDGIGGYVTHTAIYLGILTGALARGADRSILGLGLLAAVANIVHAQMYDYHRTTYSRLVIAASGSRGKRPRCSAFPASCVSGGCSGRCRGAHPQVEAEMARRSIDGVVRDDDRARYRSCFYWPVRGWNLIGDNTRFYAIGVLAWLHRLDGSSCSCSCR